MELPSPPPFMRGKYRERFAAEVASAIVPATAKKIEAKVLPLPYNKDSKR